MYNIDTSAATSTTMTTNITKTKIIKSIQDLDNHRRLTHLSQPNVYRFLMKKVSKLLQKQKSKQNITLKIGK